MVPSLTPHSRSLALAEVRLLVSSLILNYDFELLPEDQDWLAGRKVYILWENIPLRFRTTATSQNRLEKSAEKHIVTFEKFESEKAIEEGLSEKVGMEECDLIV